MNIALIGSGGREHALCQKIFESKMSKNIICIPGNAGTSNIAKNINIDFLTSIFVVFFLILLTIADRHCSAKIGIVCV